MFLVWTPGTWGEHMFPGGHLFSVLATGVVGRGAGWPISGSMAWGSSSKASSGKRGIVRTGGSASRTSGDQETTDSGGGERVSGRNLPAWQLPVGHENGPSWAASTQAFLPLGSHPTEIHEQDNRELSVLARSVLGRMNPIVPDAPIGMGGGSPSVVPPVSGARRSGRGMQPAGGNSRSPKKLNVISTGEVEMMDSLDNFLNELIVKRNDREVPLSAEAEVFSPEVVPSGGPFEEGPERSRTHGHPREVAGGGGGYTDERMLWG